jgi:predicted DCC family thiol-disulfide oxidoreductase YuxK
MRQLKRCDTKFQLNLVNVQAEEFAEKYPHIDPAKAMQILHAETECGAILVGVEANVTAWRLVDRKPWLEILRWPLIRPIADACYLFFARHRYQISRIFLGQSRCESCHLP